MARIALNHLSPLTRRGLVALVILTLAALLVPSLVRHPAFALGSSGLAVDGSAIAACSNTTSSCSATLTTSNTNDVIIVFTSETLDLQTSCTFSVSDTASLSWAARSSDVFGRGGRDQLQEFWAKTTGTLSSDSITESISGCGTNYNGLQVFGITGANFNSPFDLSTGLPGTGSDTASGQQATTSSTISNANQNDMIFAGVQHGTGAVPVSQFGFTLITSVGGAGMEYAVGGGVLTNFAVKFSFSTSSYFQQIADAVHATGSSLAVDGSAISHCSHTTNSCTATMSTSNTNDVIIVFTDETLDLQTSCTFTVADNAALSWTNRTNVVFGNGGRDQLQEWWAKTSGTLNSDTITESISGCASTQFGGEYNGLQVFGITGANFNSPFDLSTGMPGTNSGNSGGTSATITNANQNDMIFSGVQHGASPTPTPQFGFNSITSTSGYGTDYAVGGGALTSFAVTFGDSSSASWEQIADAIHP